MWVVEAVALKTCKPFLRGSSINVLHYCDVGGCRCSIERKIMGREATLRGEET